MNVDVKVREVQVIILVPNRELIMQIYNVISAISQHYFKSKDMI